MLSSDDYGLHDLFQKNHRRSYCATVNRGGADTTIHRYHEADSDNNKDVTCLPMRTLKSHMPILILVIGAF